MCDRVSPSCPLWGGTIWANNSANQSPHIGTPTVLRALRLRMDPGLWSLLQSHQVLVVTVGQGRRYLRESQVLVILIGHQGPVEGTLRAVMSPLPGDPQSRLKGYWLLHGGLLTIGTPATDIGDASCSLLGPSAIPNLLPPQRSLILLKHLQALGPLFPPESRGTQGLQG